MARITENPKFIGGGILLALLVAAYLHGPEFVRQITAPPPKPAVPPAPVLEELKFYRLVPKVLPERWQDLLQAKAGKETMFDEVPRDAKVAKREVLPDLPMGWQLSSIYFSPESRAAVISGVVVTEGEALGPFIVAKIESDRVVLKHPFGERVMNFTQPAAPAPSEAALPAQDQPSPPGMIQKAQKGIQAWQRNQEALDEVLSPKKP